MIPFAPTKEPDLLIDPPRVEQDATGQYDLHYVDSF